jgi:long-chain fatty acid transport protein
LQDITRQEIINRQYKKGGHMREYFLFIITFTLFSISVLFAGGFQVNEHGAKGSGMANAFAAIANNPSAIYFNPAGLVQLNGTHIMLGSTFILPTSGFRGPSPDVTETKMVKQIFYPINFYGTQQISEDIVVGLGVYNPYGLGTKWPNNWVGRFISNEVKLRTFYFSPTAAIQIMDNFSLGVGLDYVYSTVFLNRKADLAPFDAEADIKLDGTGSGWGFRLGLLYKPTDKLSLGLSYRSQAKISFEGTTESTYPVALKGKVPVPEGDAKTSLTTPQNITFGAAYNVSGDLIVSADFQWIGWSVYEKLRVEFSNPAYAPLEATKNYSNAYIARVGTEYKLSKNLAVRGGLFYDKNPTPSEYVDPMLPDADRIGLSFGVGYNLFSNVTLDFAYVFLRFNERTVENSKVYYRGNTGFNGTYNVFAHLLGFNISYKF